MLSSNGRASSPISPWIEYANFLISKEKDVQFKLVKSNLSLASEVGDS